MVDKKGYLRVEEPQVLVQGEVLLALGGYLGFKVTDFDLHCRCVCVYESTHGYNVQMGYVYMARPSVDERLCVIIPAMIPICTAR